MSLEADYLGAFEVHSVEGIREALSDGASPTTPIKSKAPIDCLIEGYLRSSRFADCLRLLMEAGATIADPLVEAVLLDDEAKLQRHLALAGNSELERKVVVPSAYTSCNGVTALHVCAEYNSVQCAAVLIDEGADVNATADIAADGFGGQTPIFHSVNSNQNYCRPMMEMLCNAGADLGLQLKGLRWGVGADWETLLLDVTPLSYAQCGLLPQFHRREGDVYSNLGYLYNKRHGNELRVRNVPNQYLAK